MLYSTRKLATNATYSLQMQH